MNDKFGENQRLRNYLLGTIEDDTGLTEIEMQLLTDEHFADEVGLVENELIEEFLDGELSPEESGSFVRHFLASPERRRRLRLTKNLREYSARAETIPHRERSLFEWPLIQSIYRLRLPLYAAVVVLAAIGLWRFAIYQSDTDKGIAELRKAYAGQRPLEPRMTANLGYAPIEDLRGKSTVVPDQIAFSRSERYLLDSTENSSNAKAHQALATLLLTKRGFDAALKEFNSALESSPNDASIYNDIGALYLEKAKQSNADEKHGDSLENLAVSLKNIERALELDPTLAAALFNKALVLQKMKLPQMAREAWQRYLEEDSTSPWAEEAKRNLQLIESSQSMSRISDEILENFWVAYRNKDDDKAYSVVSRNREMITWKLIPQRLIFSFLTVADEDRNDALKALVYVGQLEKERSKDLYVSEIANFYSNVSSEELADLREAYVAIPKAYELCRAAKYAEALEQFIVARAIFERSKDNPEVAFCDYWIAYCDYQMDRVKESSERLTGLVETCKTNNYTWLLAQTYYWLSVNETASRNVSRSINYGELSLAASEQTSDFYNISKSRSRIAEVQISVKQYSPALTNFAANLLVIDDPDYSDRQKWRDYDQISRLFYGLKFYAAAAAFENEAFHLNESRTKDTLFERVSLANLSRIYGKEKKYDKAIEFAGKSKDVSEKLPDVKARQKGIGYALLQMAETYRERGDARSSINYYDQAIDLYSSLEYRPYQYQAEKGRLMCFLAEDDDAAIRKGIPDTVRLFEDNREKITDEKTRSLFFDDEQDVYDLATNYEYNRGEFAAAFEYAENSRSRSLLDWRKNSGKIDFEGSLPKIVFDQKTVSIPLSLDQIQSRLPDRIQLLHYAVLPDRVLIWLIAKDRFETFAVNIPAAELRDEVITFIKAIKTQDQVKQRELSYRLYRILFRPVEERVDPARDIFLVPDKILCNLPFNALMSDKTENYLVADHKFSFTPSANVFLGSTEEAKIRGSSGTDKETLLGVGNPDFDKNEFPELQPLPDAEKEATAIAEFYADRNILLSSTATKGNIKNSASRADVIQFAGHYVANEQSYLLSSFVVAGEKRESRWSNYEVLGEKLDRPRLIVLSACQTAIEHYYDGEGMIGAGRTFLALGVPLVVASQWNVDSSATSELMVDFHRFRKKEGLSTVSALQSAQLAMLNNPNPAFRQPFYWAGFITLGGYASY